MASDSKSGSDGGWVQMISRPRISGNWPPTVVGIGSDIRRDLEAVPYFVCGGVTGGGRGRGQIHFKRVFLLK